MRFFFRQACGPVQGPVNFRYRELKEGEAKTQPHLKGELWSGQAARTNALQISRKSKKLVELKPLESQHKEFFGVLSKQFYRVSH